MTRKTASAALDAWAGSASRSARCCCNVFAGGTAAPALIPTRRKARSAAPAPNDLIEIGHGALLERGGARLLSKHLQLSRGDDGSLPRDIGRIIESHEIGPNQVGGGPATGCVHVEVGEGIVCPTRAPTFRQSSRR